MLGLGPVSGQPISSLRISDATLQVSIAAQATVSDSLAVARRLEALIASQASVATPLVVRRDLYETVSAHAIVTDNLELARELSTAIAAMARVSDTLDVARGFGDLISAFATVTVVLERTSNIATSILGQAQFADSLRIERGFDLFIQAEALVSASEAISRSMSLLVQGRGAFSDTLAVARAFNLPVQGQASVTDNLQVTSPATVDFSVAIHGQARVTDTLLVRHRRQHFVRTNYGAGAPAPKQNIEGFYVLPRGRAVPAETSLEDVQFAREMNRLWNEKAQTPIFYSLQGRPSEPEGMKISPTLLVAAVAGASLATYLYATRNDRNEPLRKNTKKLVRSIRKLFAKEVR